MAYFVLMSYSHSISTPSLTLPTNATLLVSVFLADKLCSSTTWMHTVSLFQSEVYAV